jgi:ribosomal protein S12 methylthiotransferase accessory factor
MPDSYQKHKERAPEETIQNIRNILTDLGMLMTEQWLNTTKYSCSVRLIDTLTNGAVNGKGTTPAYALASGYAECLERLQNNFFYERRLFSKETNEFGGFIIAPDEEWLTPKEILERGDRFSSRLFS